MVLLLFNQNIFLKNVMTVLDIHCDYDAFSVNKNPNYPLILFQILHLSLRLSEMPQQPLISFEMSYCSEDVIQNFNNRIY